VGYAQVAARVRNATGLDEESSPFAYAVKIQLVLVPTSRVASGAELCGAELRWDARLPDHEQRAVVGREICRWILRVREEHETESALRELYSFMFPFCEPPRAFSRRPAPPLRLLQSVPAQKPVGASQEARLCLRSARAGRPR
jgi:hypothetical protein